MKKLLIVFASQFGYHTDTLFYCKYLKREFDISYIGWDYGQERVVEDGVRVVYVSREGGKIQRLSRLVLTALRELQTTRYDVAFVVYFRFCSLVGLFGRCKTKIMDVRTGWILPGQVKRFSYNAGILLESFAFKHLTVITEELRKALKIPIRKTHVLPLGAETPDVPKKDFKTMRLLYVGTFQNRRIHETVQGFDRFASDMNGKMDVRYDIVGHGTPDDIHQMVNTIEECNNKSAITFHGRIPHTKLHPFFLKCNVGVAFVPIIAAQQPQPYTKVFEYLQAGMPVIATANDSNKKVITEENGVLVTDSPNGFCEGLKSMYARLASYDSGKIKTVGSRYSWASIINGNLRPYLVRVLSENGSR